MENKELIDFLKHVGKDPSRLIFEDELTGIRNRRFLLNYFERKVNWEALDQSPVSLLMMDIDHFKDVNDTYGHGAGDQALIYIARILKAVSEKRGLPIRYAGDEFMILLPRYPKGVARKVGEALCALVHKKPFQCEEAGGELPITMSIGLATAPDDAKSGKALIQEADTALYQSKQAGRDRVTAAGETPPQTVLAKTIIHQLEHARISGRKEQLAAVTDALSKFSERQSQFVVVEGGAGMGKTTFMEAVDATLAQSKVRRVMVSGQPQELFRPYYMAGDIILALMNQRRDMGAGAIEALEPRELDYLSHILPQLGGSQSIQDDDEASARENIFNTVLDFIPKLIDEQPLVLLMDDMHYTDEATLLLLRLLIRRDTMPVFVCGATAEPQKDDPGPMDRFRDRFGEAMGVRLVRLKPLAAMDVAAHIEGLFPGIRMPDEVPEDLARVSGGNPLFLAEILPKLVMDKKIALVDQQWTMEALEKDYLPSSLEDILAQKVASLDEESRKLLDHTSTMGEGVTLSMLTGSTDMVESRVLEFLDQAVAQGLITMDFQMNDETIRFLGKRVKEFIYGEINDERREELHEHIGNYQEALYEKDLLPSPAALAYHFQRSANLEKARKYERLQADHNSRVFNAQEALDYTGDAMEEEEEAEPLADEARVLLPKLIRGLLVSVRNMNLYPDGSAITEKTLGQFKDILDKIFETNPVVNVFIEKKKLMVNDEEMDVSEYQSVADTFFKLMRRLELRGVTFKAGVNLEELGAVVTTASRTEKADIKEDFWKTLVAQKGLRNIRPRQVQYTRIKDEDAGRQLAGEDRPRAAEEKEEELTQEEIDHVFRIIRTLLGCISKIKLYPATGPVASAALDQLQEEMGAFFEKTPVLTMAKVNDALLVNGQKVDPSEHEKVTATFLKFLHNSVLKSLTLSKYATREEMVKFIQAAINPPPEGLSSAWWLEYAKDKEIRGILFDQSVYGVMGEAILANLAAAAEEQEQEEEEEGETEEAEEAVEPEEPEEEDREGLGEPEQWAQRVSDAFFKGGSNSAKGLVGKLFREWPKMQPEQRLRYVAAIRDLLESGELATSGDFARLMGAPLGKVLLSEQQANVVQAVASLLNAASLNLLRAGDYDFAIWVFKNVEERKRNTPAPKEGEAEQRPDLSSGIGLDGPLRELVMEDLNGEDQALKKGAVRFLGCLGEDSAELFVEVIKQSKDLRIRQIAANQLKRMGEGATEKLKSEIINESVTQRKVRLLDIIDSVTSDVRTELTYALGDENISVRTAGFKLAERLGDDTAAEALMACAKNVNADLATEAVETLGRLGMASAADTIADVLRSTSDGKLQEACCKALARIGDAGAVPVLSRVLGQNMWYWPRKKYPAGIRAAAAYALAGIGGEEAADALVTHVQDTDPRIREAALRLNS
ncbi:MAG: diguanylate cyclase domain-containing protein [Desulfatibacillaceae bacterium]